MLDVLRVFRVEDRRRLHQRSGEFDVTPVLRWLAGRGLFGQEIMCIWPWDDDALERYGAR
jgi:hypothetical protein